jgi:methionyl-tRNA synthetase
MTKKPLTKTQTNKMLVRSEVWRRQMPHNEQIKQEVQAIIFHTVESLRITGILLQPFMPTKMKRLLDMLGVEESRRLYGNAVFGSDREYGIPRCDLGQGADSSLFPPLMTED